MPQPHYSQQSAKPKVSRSAVKPPKSQANGPALNARQSALVDPLSASGAQVLQLQQQYGNRAVQRLIQRARIEEADRGAAVGAEGGEVSADLQGLIDSARGGGQPLDKTVGSEMSASLGADFSGVTVHTDSKSDTLNRSLSAEAFTLGSDVFFSKGAYDPGTHGGKQLLAHELTHVVQQGAAGGHGQRKMNKAQTNPAPTGQRTSADVIRRKSYLDKLKQGSNRDPMGAGVKPQENNVIQDGRVVVRPSTRLDPAQAPYLWVVKEINGQDEVLVGQDQIVNGLRIGHPTVSATETDEGGDLDHQAKVGGELKYETYNAFNRNVRGKKAHWIVDNESGRFGSINHKAFNTKHGSNVLKGVAQLLYQRSGGNVRAKVKKLSSHTWKMRLQTVVGSQEHKVDYGHITPDADQQDESELEE